MMDALTNYAPLMPDFDAPGLAKPPACEPDVTTEALTLALERALDERRRAECMAHIQSDAVQLALDVLVTGEDIVGYFKAFIKSLVDNCESHACGVWLLDDEGECCDMWMAYIGGQFHTPETEGWAALAMPREAMAAHLRGFAPGWTETVEYAGDDARLPDAVRHFNAGGRGRLAAGGAADARADDTRLDGAGDRMHRATARPCGGTRSSTRRRGRRRWRCTTAGRPSASASRRGDRRCSRNATASPATSTTR